MRIPAPTSRERTSFDPELELPRLKAWFSENPHPSRLTLQMYVKELNGLPSRQSRKLLEVHNLSYWFKNARAAYKRAEKRIKRSSEPQLALDRVPIQQQQQQQPRQQHQLNSAQHVQPDFAPLISINAYNHLGAGAAAIPAAPIMSRTVYAIRDLLELYRLGLEASVYFRSIKGMTAADDLMHFGLAGEAQARFGSLASDRLTEHY